MEESNTQLKDENVSDATVFDYSNNNLPRDFDIRIEVAEQREVLEQADIKG